MCKVNHISRKDDDVDVLLQELSSNAKGLSSMSTEEMLTMCQEMLDNIYNRSDEWSHAGNWTVEWIKVDELRADEMVTADNEGQTMASVERFQLGDSLAKFLQTYSVSLKSKLDSSNKPALLKTVRTESDVDQNEFSVYGPVDVPFPGHKFEVWTKSDKAQENESSNSDQPLGPVAVVLGAGNQPFLSLVDVAECIFMKRKPVLLKHHPLRPFLIEPCKIIFEPLFKRGLFTQVLDEGVPKTIQILESPLVGHVHITGSLATDTAVRSTLKKSRPSLSDTQINNMVTSELGAVTPLIVVPGTYTEAELRHMASMVATSKKANGGCNCLNANALVLPKDWEQIGDFRNALIEALKHHPDMPTYYPGSRERKKKIAEPYFRWGEDRAIVVEAATHMGPQKNSEDSVVILECGTPGEAGYEGSALRTEAFGSALAIVELNSIGVTSGDFLSAVVAPFLNDKSNIYGTLSCTVFAPTSVESSALKPGVASLRYGTVSVNCPTFIGYLGMVQGGVWGAHPCDEGRESGHGYIGNIFELPNVDKTVAYGPPLTKAPLVDGSKAPPALLLDAMHAATCSPSKLIGTTRLLQVVYVRFVAALLSPILPARFVQYFTSKYGKAMNN